MKVSISYTGNLNIIAENDTELYALKKWVEDSVTYSDTEDIIKIGMGSFDITNNYIDQDNPGCESLLDHVMEMKELIGEK